MTSAKSGEGRHDNLSAIKGIGEATEQSLNRALGVWTYEDLAARSTDEIEAGLKASGRAISRNQIEEWLARARELAGVPARSPRRDGRSESGRVTRKSKPALEHGSWKPFATFVVELQSRTAGNGAEEQRTVCQQHETAKEEAWPGIDCEQTCQWMLDQIEEQLSAIPGERPPIQTPAAKPPSVATETASSETQSVEPPPVTVEITEVRAFQPLESETPRAVATADGNVSGVVTGGEPVSFEVSFQLAGPGARNITDSDSRFTAEIYAYNRTTSASELLATAEPGSMVEGVLSYGAVLAKATLPSGTYRLECSAALEGAHPMEGYLKVPFLRVA